MSCYSYSHTTAVIKYQFDDKKIEAIKLICHSILITPTKTSESITAPENLNK